jgi:hypothetical protein
MQERGEAGEADWLILSAAMEDDDRGGDDPPGPSEGAGRDGDQVQLENLIMPSPPAIRVAWVLQHLSRK